MAEGAAIRTLGPLPALDYVHSETVELPRAISPLEAWRRITAGTGPGLRLAFWMRDVVSAAFGVTRIGGFSGQVPDTVSVGDRMDFFLVEEVASDLLVLTARDRHLDVMLCLATEGRRLTITASVITHERFGRLYMMPVGPAHRLIVGKSLRRLKRELEEA